MKEFVIVLFYTKVSGISIVLLIVQATLSLLAFSGLFCDQLTLYYGASLLLARVGIFLYFSYSAKIETAAATKIREIEPV